MSNVTVHRWRLYDIASDQTVISRRLATQEAIDRARGEAIPGTAVQVSESDLDPDCPGMTPRNFEPHRGTGFQRQVRT